MDIQTFQIVISVIVGTLIPALGTFIVLVINSLKKYKLAIITAKKGNEELVVRLRS
nr:truncated Imm [Mycoplasma phage MAV1] [Metamycoplasma arthritidis]